MIIIIKRCILFCNIINNIKILMFLCVVDTRLSWNKYSISSQFVHRNVSCNDISLYTIKYHFGSKTKVEYKKGMMIKYTVSVIKLNSIFYEVQQMYMVLTTTITVFHFIYYIYCKCTWTVPSTSYKRNFVKLISLTQII